MSKLIKTLPLLIMAILFSASSDAQQNDTAISKYLIQSKQAYMDGNLDSATALARKAATEAKLHNDQQSYSKAQLYLGNFMNSRGMLDSAMWYYKKVTSSKTAAPANRISALMNIGIIYDYMGEVDSAIITYNHAIALADSAGDNKLKGMAVVNLGSFYDDRGNYQTALEYYLQGLPLLNEANSERQANILKVNIGGVLNKLGQNEQALAYYKEVLENEDQTLGSFLKANTYLKVSRSYLQMDSLERSNEYLLELFAKLETFDNVRIKIEANILKGRIERRSGRLNSAIDYFQKAYQMAKKATLPSFLSESSFYLASIYLANNDNTTAIQYAKESYDIALQNEDYNWLVSASEILAQAYEAIGNKDLAIEYLKNQLIFSDTLSKQNEANEVNRLLLDHKQYDYQLLKKEKELQELKLQNQQKTIVQNRVFIIGTSFFAVILLALLVWLFSIRQKEKRLKVKLEEHAKKVRLQNDKLSELNRDKDKLMHVVAHDLRNPMNAINGFAYLIEMDADLDSEQQENLQMIKKSITHGLSIIDELLSLKEGKSNSLQKDEFNLVDVFNDVISELENSADRKEISISTYAPNEVNVMNDKLKLKRIFENLVSNAIKFSKPGGSIIVSMEEKDDQVQFVVKDNGPGFSEEDKEKLFQKFQKLSAKPTGGEASTGIGLAIVKDFLELLNGDIKVANREGGGAVITIWIPKNASNS